MEEKIALGYCAIFKRS